jgi:probable HAF family extracellular repeat protein
MEKAKILACFLVLTTLCCAQPILALEVTPTDIGTLGGICSAKFINDQGQVSGTSWTEPEYPSPNHAFFWTKEEGIVDLTPSNSENSWPTAMNELGQIVGIEVNAPGQGFIWTSEQGIKPIPNLGGLYSNPYDINNLGQVVGISETAENEWHAFLWTPGEEIIMLPIPEEITYSKAYAINDSGQVVGEFQGPGVANAFSWTEEDGMVNLYRPDDLRSLAVAVNDLGQVLVRYHPNIEPYNMHAFIWSKEGGMVDIGHLGGDYTWAIDINDSGQVVGQSKDENGKTTLFLWSEETGMMPIGDNLLTSNIAAINNLSQITFTGRTPEENSLHAYLWTEQDGSQQLDDLMGDDQAFAYAINNRGQVAGHTLHIEPFEYHATLWTFQTILPPDEHIDAIIDEVAILIDSGTLNQGQGNALISKLEAAKNQLDKDNVTTTCNLIRAFINQVQALIKSGKITLAEGQILLDNANSLIDELGCD